VSDTPTKDGRRPLKFCECSFCTALLKYEEGLDIEDGLSTYEWLDLNAARFTASELDLGLAEELNV
jgi:hypothetical protein